MKINVIETGNFKLDGGAMFGVVPKRLWTRYNAADDNNLCTWAMRCLFIQEGDQKILIDTGLGNKQDERFRSFFEPHGDDSLLNSLKNVSVSPEEITDVILTHLHFDHVGGALMKDPQGKIRITFPNATYWCNELHYNWAYDPNPREKASFLKENFVPLKENGILKMIKVEQDIQWNGFISFKFCYGHTEAMMLPIIKISNGKTIAYCADLIPSHGHIGLPYVMSYDVRPLETIKEKESFYHEALEKDYILFLEHDKDYECCKIRKNEKGRIVIDQLMTLAEALTS